jgi:hypothetical protein
MTSEAPRGEGRRGANERLWLGGWGSAPVGHVNKRDIDLFRHQGRSLSSPIRLAQSRIGEALWRGGSVVRRKDRASLDVAASGRCWLIAVGQPSSTYMRVANLFSDALT